MESRKRKSSSIETAISSPKQILSLAEHISPVEDESEIILSKQRGRKHNKEKRKRPRSETNETSIASKKRSDHAMSDSEQSVDFLGFDDEDYLPMYASRQQSRPNTQSNWPFCSTEISTSLQEPRPSTPMPEADGDLDDDAIDGFDCFSQSPREPKQARSMLDQPQCMNNSLSKTLDQFMHNLNDDENVGPNVWPNVATLVEKTWNLPHKEDIKELYVKHKRPGNTPSLEKVTLDREISTGLAERFPAAKRTDAALGFVNNALVKTAVCLTEILHVNQTQMSPEEVAKHTMAKAFDALRILAYGNSHLHNSRRQLIKYTLDPSLRQPLLRNSSLETTNSSHQLFGGEMQKQAKEGQ